MHDEAGLWDELEALYAAAGSDPASFRKLERGARRAGEDLQAYYREVARDYIERLERRLTRPNARLTDDERALVRAWVGVAPFEERGERRLLQDLAELRAAFDRLRELRATPLSPESVTRLAELVDETARRAATIAEALDAKSRARALDDALGSGAKPLDREGILARIRRALLEDGEPSKAP